VPKRGTTSGAQVMLKAANAPFPLLAIGQDGSIGAVNSPV
jgi:hypothetical protein